MSIEDGDTDVYTIDAPEIGYFWCIYDKDVYADEDMASASGVLRIDVNRLIAEIRGLAYYIVEEEAENE